MTTTAPLFPPTTNSCPSWCTQPSGHGYDSLTHDGGSARGHYLDVGDLDLAKDEDGHPREAWVSIAALETATADESTVLSLEQPSITLYASHTVGLTPAEARQLAAVLTKAADQLEAIQMAGVR